MCFRTSSPAGGIHPSCSA